jgi:hypothetical protein
LSSESHAPRRGRGTWIRSALALVTAAALAACAPERDDDLYGMNLEVRSELEWAQGPELRRRVRELVAESCAHVGLDPTQLYGMTLRIEDGAIECGEVKRARGCTWRTDGVIAVSTLAWHKAKPPVPCVEDTPLPHELLHVAIGDAHHEDERWESSSYWDPLWSRVSRPDCSGDYPDVIW